MSDPKTVETLQRYKGRAQGDRGASWQGTHHEPIAKYPSFYTGKGLERGTAAGDVGWNAGKGEHAAYMKSKQQDPAASTVAGSPPSLIGERRYNRRDGMALKGVDTEVSAAALGQGLKPGAQGARGAAARPVCAGVCRTLTVCPPQVKHQFMKLPGTATGVMRSYIPRMSPSLASSRSASPAPSVK